MPCLVETHDLIHNLYNTHFIKDINGSEFEASHNNYVFNYIHENLHNTEIFKKNNIFMFWRAYGHIFQIENWYLDEEIVEKINMHGLNIYLYEIDFFSENIIKPKRKPTVQDSNATYIKDAYGECVDNINSKKKYYSLTLNSIQTFVNNNNLKKVTVKYPYYNAKKSFVDYNFSIAHNNICLPAQINLINRYYSEPIVNESNIIKHKITAPFWRYDSFRHLLAAYFANNKEINMSWHYSCSFDILKKNIWFDLDQKFPSKIVKKIEKGNKILSENYFHIDNTVKRKKTLLNGKEDKWKFPPGYDGCVIENILQNIYKKSFIIFVSESTFTQPFVTISEKILIAIKCKRPFIVAGPPNTLDYLKKLGFKTFDQWWDESYDQEQNHEKRILKILHIVDEIVIKDLFLNKKCLEEMHDILCHNHNLIIDNLKIKWEIK